MPQFPHLKNGAVNSTFLRGLLSVRSSDVQSVSYNSGHLGFWEEELPAAGGGDSDVIIFVHFY